VSALCKHNARRELALCRFCAALELVHTKTRAGAGWEQIDSTTRKLTSRVPRAASFGKLLVWRCIWLLACGMAVCDSGRVTGALAGLGQYAHRLCGGRTGGLA
jgi:hypothetical protein